MSGASVWDSDATMMKGPAVDDAAFDAFERRYSVRLPESFKQVYRIQNGGVLRDVEWPEYLLPIRTETTVFERIASLQEWAEAGLLVDADDLDEVENELGDPCLILLLWGESHAGYALNYNDRSADDEPAIVCLDFEGFDSSQAAPSFDVWIRELTRSETDCAVDWNERHGLPILFEDRFTTDLTAHGAPEQIETAVCRTGDNSLVMFRRTTSQGQEVQLERVSLPHGVDEAGFRVESYRPGPVITGKLHLQPVHMNDIHWVTSRSTQDGGWKNERSAGVPIYCVVESTDRAALESLAGQLRDSGIVHAGESAEPSDLPEEFRDEMRQMEQMAEMLMKRTQEHMAGDAPAPRDAPPEDGGDPALMSDDAVTDELTGLILYFAGQVGDVHHKAEAEQLIDRFVPHTKRYIDLLRRLDVAGNPMNGMGLAPAEMVSRDALTELHARCSEAGQLLEHYGSQVLMEALRPTEQGEDLDAFVAEFQQAMANVAAVLVSIMADKAVEPHQPALVSATAEYDQCQKVFWRMIAEMDAPAAGWLQQKRISDGSQTALQQHWHDLRTKHRALYKQHRQLFAVLEDNY